MLGPKMWILVCWISFLLAVCRADDIVVGCGGFVKSDVEINYSLIEVRVARGLGARQGSCTV